jgi:pyruvate carboxylase
VLSFVVQVEHTVTEEITGIDIVQTQIKIAGGASLSELGLGSQAAVPAPKGYAIQCRVTSEDPEQNFQVSVVLQSAVLAQKLRMHAACGYFGSCRCVWCPLLSHVPVQ